MSEDRNIAPATGGEQQPAPEPRGAYENDHAAGRALEGLLFADDDTENSEPDEGSNTESGESQTIRSEEPDATETAKPSIEAPGSWSAEDKALFSKLPPETQAVIARRESEREKHFQTRAQEIANERQSWSAERDAMVQQRTQYVQSLQQLAALALPELKQFENIDWVRLSAEQPAEAVRLQGLREATMQRIGTLQQQINQTQQQQQADMAKRFEAFRSEQQAKLVERVPEFGNAEKAPKIVNELRGFLRDTYGFNEQEIGGVVDHRLVVMAHELMRYRQADAARQTAQTEKKANVAPRVQRPGSQQGSDSTVDQEVRGLARQLGRTNNMRDAANLLEKIL